MGTTWRRAKIGFTGLVVGAGLTPVQVSAQAPAGLTGTVVVVNKQEATASFIDLTSGGIVATVPTGDGPHELVVSRDGRTAVVSDYGARTGGRTLTVLDVAARRVARTIELADYTRPHGIVFLPGDSLVAVTSEANRAVLLVRVADGDIVQEIPTEAGGSHMVAVTRDGERLFTGNITDGTVSELSRARGARIATYSTAPQPEAINVTPDGDRVFAGSNAEGTVSEIRTDDGRRREIADGFDWPYRIFLTPGVAQIIIPDLAGESLRFLDGGSYEELGRMEFSGAAPQGLTLHPDGRHLFLSLSGQDRIAVVDIVTRTVVGYLPAGDGPDGIGYSSLPAASGAG